MPEFERVAVAGAGLMGHAIGFVHALGGCRVRLFDLSPERLGWAGERITQLGNDLIELGLATADTVQSAIDRLSYDTALGDAIVDADLVVEAIVEDPDAKRQLYDGIAPLLKPSGLIASNTSFLDVFPLMPEVLLSRSLIVHWYTPPYLIDLVDVVPGPTLPSEQLSRMTRFLSGLGKRPVVLKKFVPGYVANNVQMAIESEVFRLLDAGVADVSAIDDAIRHGLAARLLLMGQFKKIDYTGLEVVQTIHASGDYVPPSQPTGSRTLDANVSAGKTGVAAGAGFYDYRAATQQEWLQRRDLSLAALKQALAAIDTDL